MLHVIASIKGLGLVGIEVWAWNWDWNWDWDWWVGICDGSKGDWNIVWAIGVEEALIEEDGTTVGCSGTCFWEVIILILKFYKCLHY